MFASLVACADDAVGSDPLGSPEVAEVLAEMVNFANGQDWEALCSLHSSGGLLGECTRAAAALGDHPPRFEAIVTGERELESAGAASGGRVLEICVTTTDAVTAARASTSTEVLFISDGDAPSHIVVPHPHFWEPRTFPDGPPSNIAEPRKTPLSGTSGCT